MQKNEFIGKETFETFLSKKLNQRTGKRLIFPTSNYKINQKEMLNEYMDQIKEKEKTKQEAKQKRIEEEKF